MTWRDLVYLNKSDRQVLLALLVVGVIALAAFFFAGGKDDAAKDRFDAVEVPLQHGQRTASSAPKYYYVEGRRVERFAFDPNTADSTQLLRLGLQPWQVRNIYKYRAAGGIYREKADFANLYGLTVKQYRELEPYIQISPDYLPASTLRLPRQHARSEASPSSGVADSAHAAAPVAYSPKIKAGETVDLNALDTTVYKTVPGIGSFFARRILDYGRRLGGYVSVDQLREIDDFPMESAIFFIVSAKIEPSLRINRLSLNELKRHPYINYYMARAIVDYRRQQGPIHDLHDLSLLPEFPEDVIARLRPYVSYE
ncbi:MAG: helix-hairpin-helix domain-containing protein [Prevotella sp.]|nr:helix-hairpin-helix domain-containing protein [Prevotella sp.]